jgi:hypothetical protein
LPFRKTQKDCRKRELQEIAARGSGTPTGEILFQFQLMMWQFSISLPSIHGPQKFLEAVCFDVA